MSSDADEDVIEDGKHTSPNKIAEVTKEPVIPEASKERYLQIHDNFMTWRNNNGENTFSETVLLAYFRDLAKINKPTTIKMIFSMLATTLFIKEGADIKKYPGLRSYLLKLGYGYKCKKCKILTKENMQQFLSEAPDIKYLVWKVALILGIRGTCGSMELYNLTMKDLEWRDSSLKVTLRNTTAQGERMFFLRNEDLSVVKKYHKLRLRRGTTKTDRFFFIYKSGRCLNQPLGRTKIQFIPRNIAKYLNLPDPNRYTGNCFRTSARYLTSHRLRIRAEVFLRDPVVKNGNIPENRKGKFKIEPLPENFDKVEASKQNEENFAEQDKSQPSETMLIATESRSTVTFKQLSEAKLESVKLQRRSLEIDLKQKEIKLNETIKQHEFNEEIRKKQLRLINIKIQKHL